MPKLIPLLAALCFIAPAASAQDAYKEFSDTLREQNDKGCDTSYVGGYVSLYQSLTLLCNLRKDKAISPDNFNRYANDVISVLASDERLQLSNVKAALLYAIETCSKQNIALPIKANE